VKMILATVAFATLITTPLFAQSQNNERSPGLAVHLKQKKQRGVDYRDLYLSAGKSNQPTSNADPTEQRLCSAAPSFCPDYHGSNGA
jgi:hypothetical protein